VWERQRDASSDEPIGELDFIINYDIKYRMGREGQTGDTVFERDA